MKPRLSLLVVFVLASAQAVASSGGADGLDLVLLVDRSGSMARRDIELLIGLTLDLVARNAQANRVMHRVAMVSFASTAHVDMPLKPVDLNARAALSVRGRRASGHTDILAAFQAAARLFEAQPSRRRAVLLITDGIPCVPKVSLSVHQDAVTRFVAARFHDTAVSVALLPPNVGYVEFWRTLSMNRVQTIDGPASLHQMVAKIVGTRVQQSRTVAAEQRIVLPPYLQSVVFDVFRGSHGGAVDAFAPGATEPLRTDTPGVEEVRLSGRLSSIVVGDPAPGVWRFRAADADGTVRVSSQEFFPRGVLIRPEPDRPLPQHTRTHIAYRLHDQVGQPLIELSAYPLSVDVRLVEPDGRTVSKPLHHRRDLGASVFATTDAVTCNAFGRYWTEVRVSTLDAERRRVCVLHDRWSGFSVAAGPRVDSRESVIAPAKVELAPSRQWLLSAAVTALGIVLVPVVIVLRKRYLRS